MFAKVVVDVKTSDVDIMYTYKIPQELEELVGIGSRVIVTFGVRKILGYIIELMEKCDYEGEVKEVIDVLDFSQQLTKEQIELAKYIKEQSKCFLVTAIESMFPSLLRTRYKKYIYAINPDLLDAEIALLFNGKQKIAIQSDVLKKYPKIAREIKKGNLSLEYDFYNYGKSKKEKLYSVNKAYEYLFNSLTAKKTECINYVENNENCTITDIIENVGCSAYLVQSLVKNEYLLVKEEYIDLFQEEMEKSASKIFSFSFEQRQLIEKYELLSNKPFLLYSNDESFKLDFYLFETIKTVSSGKKVMIVTPTIYDNYRILKYFKNHLFGYKIVSFSNDLSNADFYNHYMRVINDDYDIVVTTKVGALVPLNNLGMIIVIREEDFNYLSEQSPKFNLVKSLEFRSKYHNAKIVLETISPQITSYDMYSKAKYILLKHITSFKNEKILVDMNKEFGSSSSVISEKLQMEIEKCLKRKQQVVLMLNLRGYSNHIVCRNCGKIIRCDKCGIPLTYYKDKDESKCKYCGKKAESLVCENCNGRYFTFLKNGLDGLKEKVESLFPQARVLQMDSETIKTSADYHEALLMIENQDVDIIIGTRNVFSIFSSEIRLLGIINIDDFLSSSDYRSSENAFNLIAECLSHNECTTVIQGYHLNHPTIINAINNEYDAFYDEELKTRKELLYPPYCEINRLIITGQYKDMYYCANYLKKIFLSIIKENADALGPVYLPKYKGVQVILKHNNFEKVSEIIDEVGKKFSENKVMITFERYPRSFS